MSPSLVRRAATLLAVPSLYELVGSFRSPFRGVYGSFDEARKSIPANRKVGYDHAETAAMYIGYAQTLRLSDYPVLFWMRPAIEQAASVFDLGGHVGLACYAFEKYLPYPPGLRWMVCDLPEIRRAGERIAAERNANRLSFTGDFLAADGADILLTAGTLQCMEISLASILSQLRRRPKHLLVNRLPLYDGQPFATVQDIGPVMIPYQIFNRQQFIDSVCGLGYRLIDAWQISEPLCGMCVIPFHSERSLSAYSGLYFIRADQPGANER
jgi:putative methyltransferase (TIGR04325 family)